MLTGSRVGKDCNVGQNVVIGPEVHIGDGCKIQNNVSVYEGVTLEDEVFCGPSMVFTNVTTPRAFVNRKSEFAPTLVRRGASIGANATIVCGSTVGRFALIGAGAVVTGDVTQIDLPDRQESGLKNAVRILGEVAGISFTFFTPKDVVRHRLVQRIVEAYESDDNGGGKS